MKRAYVELSFWDRKKSIKKQIEKIEKNLGINVPIDEDLLNHVANLTEFPSVLHGEFDKEFLEVPKEVNISVMKNHQKYFPVFKDKKLKKLDSKFIFVAGSPFLNKKVVISGNEKVIRARLDDAKFFYNEDKNFGLTNIQKKLSSTTFIDNAGTYDDKSERIFRLSKDLVKKLKIENLISYKNLETTCKLIKADLSSQMVYEFPELQGLMGSYYYKNQDPYIAEVIEQHYSPKGRSDSLPTNEIAKIISICDKLDTITCCFSLGLIPTGSSDPYGLRRNSIGIIRIAESLSDNLNLTDLLNLSFECFEANFDKKVGSDSKNKAVSFFIDRIRNYLTDMGYHTKIINSALNTNSEIIDIVSIKNKIKLIEDYNSKDNLLSAIEADKRLKNIVKDNKDLTIDLKIFNDPFELKLYKKYIKIKESFSDEAIQSNPTSSMTAILDIANDLSDFFENVLVMVDDDNVKKNRINLLTNIKNLISKFINLSEI
jgi:glycyl-tRNA synthetase beta chain